MQLLSGLIALLSCICVVFGDDYFLNPAGNVYNGTQLVSGPPNFSLTYAIGQQVNVSWRVDPTVTSLSLGLIQEGKFNNVAYAYWLFSK
jgi:hypothetical protein